MTNISLYSEQELIPLLQQRCEQSFSYLYDNYCDSLFGAILQIVPDRELAGDILQEVFIKIWQKIDHYDPSRGRLFTWMINIARNQSIDRLRSKSYQYGRKIDSIADNEFIDKNENVMSLEVDKIGLRKLLEKLPPHYRKLIYLAYFNGYTNAQIAEMENIPLGTVKTGIRNSIIKLKIYLAQTDISISYPVIECTKIKPAEGGDAHNPCLI